MSAYRRAFLVRRMTQSGPWRSISTVVIPKAPPSRPLPAVEGFSRKARRPGLSGLRSARDSDCEITDDVSPRECGPNSGAVTPPPGGRVLLDGADLVGWLRRL